MTQPIITSSTSSGRTPARLTLSRTTSEPRSVAEKPFNAPWNFPVGVRTALMMTASLLSVMIHLYQTVTSDGQQVTSKKKPLALHSPLTVFNLSLATRYFFTTFKYFLSIRLYVGMRGCQASVFDETRRLKMRAGEC